MKFLMGACLFILPAKNIFSQGNLSLAGYWQFRLDPDSSGEKKHWYLQKFSETIHLPGTTDEARKGIKTSGPDYGILSRAYKYVGPAWYTREINIPAAWKGKDIELFLERVIWESKVWVDGKIATTKDALAVPHVHRLGKLAPGKHLVTLRVNNDLIYNIGDKGHVYTEYTQSIWNGAVGKIELRARETTHITDLQVYPDADNKKLSIKLKVENPAAIKVVYAITDLQTGKKVFSQQKLLTDKEEQTTALQLNFPIKLWDEFSPNRYRIAATQQNKKDEVTADFGFRSVMHSKSKILINNAPVFMRGNLDCVHSPLTGYPSCDV